MEQENTLDGVSEEIALLRSLAAFEVLAPEVLRTLAPAEWRALEAGEVLFRSGMAADSGYVLASGRIALVDERADGTRHVVEEVTPVALIGEVALIAATVRPFAAVAVEASRLLCIPRAAFLKALEADPAAAVKLRDIFVRRLEQMLAALDGVRVEMERTRTMPRRR